MTNINYSQPKHVDVFLLDWNARRPFGLGPRAAALGAECVAAFDAGRYEYSFSLDLAASSDVLAAEAAYAAQGNNASGKKVRRDRQSMSTADAVLVDGRAYVAASVGFDRVAELDARLGGRIEQSWERWTEQEVRA